MSSTILFNVENFQEEVINSPIPVLVDFWAPWCSPCKTLSPTIDELSIEFADKIKVGKVNVDDNPELAQQYGIRSIPTIFIFNEGEIISADKGALSKDNLRDRINEHV